MTRKLYYKDPYAKEFDAKVVKVNGNKVILDQTCFYPWGGGQIGDTGEISGIRVVDTQKTTKDLVEMNDGFKAKPVSDEVIHILEREPEFKEGDTIHGRIDWDRRYRIMKLHSAAHITYFIAVEVFGMTEIKGSYVDDKKDRFDFVYDGRLDPDKLQELEGKANEFIAKNVPIERFERDDQPGIWVWKAEGLPEMHCGGTHVKNTSEIGKVRVKRKNPGSGLERIETYLAE
jgi:alanyl-tRNA synthetase